MSVIRPHKPEHELPEGVYVIAAGIFAVRIFAVGLFAVRLFVVWNFCRTEFLPYGTLGVWNFCSTEFSP